ncbi:MAG TPA: aromatic ring-hydroxylating dioxygenase subunit alpha [Stellaceae bacterium]|nr:aromatic ring-hydroxylating dioxygenase subunit alpha [Stellaceae bacterium]
MEHGARYAQLIDDRPDEGIFRINRTIYNDPAILEAEYRSIFEGGWLFLCHESIIPRPGDFFSTHMGRQPIFVVRTEDGAVAAYLNACGHRGSLLVKARSGNVQSIICPYHGFCFDMKGRCVAVPKRATGWPGEFELSQFDLRPIARIESYRGLVFGCLTPDVPSLREHLGAATALIDIFVAPAPQPLEVVSGYSIYQTACNWKIMHENGPDAYHAPVVHNNFAAAIAYREKRSGAEGLRKTDTGRLTARIASASYDLGNGHTAFWHERPSPEAFPISAQKDALARRFTPGQLAWIVERGRHMTIFPNLLLNDLASTHLRVYRPLGVDRMETIIWCLAPVGEPAEARAARLRKFEDFFLASGMATPDDVAIAEGAQQASWAHASPWSVLSRGLSSCSDGPDAAARELGFAPRVSSDSWDHEVAIRGVYRRWLEMMEHNPERRHV